MHVLADREICIGAGQCVVAAPDVFDQDDDGRVLLITDNPTDDSTPSITDAVSACPSGALSLQQINPPEPPPAARPPGTES